VIPSDRRRSKCSRFLLDSRAAVKQILCQRDEKNSAPLPPLPFALAIPPE
jgi:hypothetical protein